MMRLLKLGLCITLLALLTACAGIDRTKTAEVYYEPTSSASVQILKTKPDEAFTELGTITVLGFSSTDTAKMHNAIRSKAASLGANAVILTDEGLAPNDSGTYDAWATGVAIFFKKP
jgi:hypothetical protein